MKVKIAEYIKMGFLFSLCGLFAHHFYFNPKGVRAQRKLKAENQREKVKIAHLQEEVTALRNSITGLSSNDFEQEKIMREDLQMSCTNEYVYLLRNQT